MRLLSPIQALIGLYANLATARVSLGRVHQLLDAEADVVERTSATPLPEVRGDVVFENVTLSFDRGGPVLDRVSFSVKAGEILAVVGPSGSGKSTIADLLLRLLDPDTGCVRLDGHDLRDVRLHDLRGHVVSVDQEPFTFHKSITENIRYGRPQASNAEIVAAARGRASIPSSKASQRSTKPWWGNAAQHCRLGSGSGLPSPARTSRIPPCSCWTNPRHHWTPSRNGRSSRATKRSYRVGRRS